MPFSKQAVTTQGGSNCCAIRYRASVPPFEDRPVNPYRTPDADVGDARVPFVVINHCNDCRRATSTLMPAALVTTIAMTSVSLLPKNSLATAANSPKASVSDDERVWVPIASITRDDVGDVLEGTTLGNYLSSQERNRWFCTRCGTPIASSISNGAVPKDWNRPKMFDIWAGTVDRTHLEKE